MHPVFDKPIYVHQLDVPNPADRFKLSLTCSSGEYFAAERAHITNEIACNQEIAPLTVMLCMTTTYRQRPRKFYSSHILMDHGPGVTVGAVFGSFLRLVEFKTKARMLLMSTIIWLPDTIGSVVWLTLELD